MRKRQNKVPNHRTHNAPETHNELVYEAKQNKFVHKKEKYATTVFEVRINSETKKETLHKLYELQSYSKERLKKSMNYRSAHTKDIILKFSEIFPINGKD